MLWMDWTASLTTEMLKIKILKSQDLVSKDIGVFEVRLFCCKSSYYFGDAC